VVVSRSNFQIHFLGFCNGRFPHIRFPVHTGLLSCEKIDELSSLIPNVDRDLTVIGIEISPGIFLDVCTIDINGSRISGQILASICVTIRIIQLEDQNVSGLGTSNLDIIVSIFSISEVICSLLKVDSWPCSAIIFT